MIYLFLDTSFLVKLFMDEADSEYARLAVDSYGNNVVLVISAVTSLEFRSAIGRKYRSGLLDEQKAKNIYDEFEKNLGSFQIVPFTSTQLLAKTLMAKYWKQGLRTLNSLQLAAMVTTKELTSAIGCSDNLLRKLIEHENLNLIDIFQK